MWKHLAGALLLFCLISHSSASYCSETTDHTYGDAAGSFGCDGYADQITVRWLIQLNNNNANKRVMLRFTSFDTEARYDFVSIYDGLFLSLLVFRAK